MGQVFKAVYFGDIPRESSKSKNLTLAFGRDDEDVFNFIRPLSSEEVRTLLGYSNFGDLSGAAATNGESINKFCVRRLRSRLSTGAQLPLLPEISQDAVDPLQATYRDGRGQLLHEWYPYLEGYSYGFVDRILSHHCPDRRRILDPFGGCGTTAIAASTSGIPCFYCEINPVLQFVTEAKVLALASPVSNRAKLADSLESVAATLEARIAPLARDRGLLDCYNLVFHSAVFFKRKNFNQVLRIRTFLDHLACQDLPLTKLLTVAVLASLVPSSLLIRRGDLRFRTDEELIGYDPDFLDIVQQNVRMIARDLREIDILKVRPILLCEDARALANMESCAVDCVITSPPYLNGTNYFRNTKLELWFLRALRSRAELANFRYKAITAGINDVTRRKLIRSAILESTRELIGDMSTNAYDSRIPAMVQCYFSEMRDVFLGLKRHLISDSFVAVDIGDSSYNNVHVPTHEILKQILLSEGFSLHEEVTVRRRVSRSGQPLAQKLLIFTFRGDASSTLSRASAWQSRWSFFKARLPHQAGEFQKRNWGHPLHSLCSYQGKMKPSIAAHLVHAFVPTGGRLLDPFSGVGTIPFEGALAGIRSWAFDISPTAAFITQAKLGKPDADRCLLLLDRLGLYLCKEELASCEVSSARALGFNGTLGEYFHERTLREVLLARRYFRLHSPASSSEALVFACLLHILHGNRPYALSRRSHPITPFAPTGKFEHRPLIPRLADKVRRSLSVEYPADFVEGQFILQDATASWPVAVCDLDAVITSPPFFDSTRFHLANWMRLWFCGWEQSDFRTRPREFVDELQKQSFEVYEPVFRQARERLKPGGVMVLHLGKSKKCNMQEHLLTIARNWFSVLDTFTENVRHCEHHGIRDKGTVTDHQYLVLG